MDIVNKFMVSLAIGKPSQIIIMLPPVAHQPISKHDALNLAAWLVALADEGDGYWPEIQFAVENT